MPFYLLEWGILDIMQFISYVLKSSFHPIRGRLCSGAADRLHSNSVMEKSRENMNSSETVLLIHHWRNTCDSA